MFPATPVNRGTQDLFALVDLLGADNSSDDTLRILDGLAKHGSDATLSDEDRSQIRDEIQRFTVRRTKSRLNALVDREPDAYRHPLSGRPSRDSSPRHLSERVRSPGRQPPRSIQARRLPPGLRLVTSTYPSRSARPDASLRLVEASLLFHECCQGVDRDLV